MEVLSGMAEKQGHTHVYEGTRAFMNINSGWLKKKDPIYVFGGPPANNPAFLKYEIPKWHKKRIEAKVKMLHIYTKDNTARIKMLNKMDYTSAGYIPGKFSPNMTTSICGDEIILTFWHKTALIIQIKSEIAAQTYKEFFKVLWEQVVVPE